MSYLSEMIHRQITAKQFLAKSVVYLKEKAGITVSDDGVDVAVEATDKFTDALQALAVIYIQTHFPDLPGKATAVAGVTALLNTIDAAAAGAGNVIKANN